MTHLCGCDACLYLAINVTALIDDFLLLSNGCVSHSHLNEGLVRQKTDLGRTLNGEIKARKSGEGKIKQEGKEKNVKGRKMMAMTIKLHEGDVLQMALGSDFYFPVFRHGLIQAVTHNITSSQCSFLVSHSYLKRLIQTKQPDFIHILS